MGRHAGKIGVAPSCKGSRLGLGPLGQLQAGWPCPRPRPLSVRWAEKPWSGVPRDCSRNAFRGLPSGDLPDSSRDLSEDFRESGGRFAGICRKIFGQLAEQLVRNFLTFFVRKFLTFFFRKFLTAFFRDFLTSFRQSRPISKAICTKLVRKSRKKAVRNFLKKKVRNFLTKKVRNFLTSCSASFPKTDGKRASCAKFQTENFVQGRTKASAATGLRDPGPRMGLPVRSSPGPRRDWRVAAQTDPPWPRRHDWEVAGGRNPHAPGTFATGGNAKFAGVRPQKAATGHGAKTVKNYNYSSRGS